MKTPLHKIHQICELNLSNKYEAICPTSIHAIKYKNHHYLINLLTEVVQ